MNESDRPRVIKEGAKQMETVDTGGARKLAL